MAPKPRMPQGLGPEGKKLWESVVGVFDLTIEPHKRRILFDTCKTADVIKRLVVCGPLPLSGFYPQAVWLCDVDTCVLGYLGLHPLAPSTWKHGEVA